MSENAGVTRAAGTISGVTLISRVLGLIRDMVLAGTLGAGFASDAFFAAFRISNMLRELFAEGSMSAAFIPVFTEYFTLRSKEEARELASSVFSVLLVMLFGLTMLGILLAPYIVGVMVYGFRDNPEQFATTVYLTRLMFPYIIFIGLAAVTMGVLNSTGSFTAPAFAPVMLNVCIISSALLMPQSNGEPAIWAVALGVVAGGAMQLAIQLPPLKKKGMSLFWLFKPMHEGVRKIFRLSVPIVGSLAVTQINLLVSMFFASFLMAGSITYLYYATRLYQFPHGVFGIALATAILPSMSRQAASGDTGSLRDTMAFGIRYILFINIPAAVGLAVLAVPITSLLLQRADFNYEDTVGTAYALYFFSVGLWAFSSVRVVNAAFYSLNDTKTPVKTAFVSALANAGLSLVLMKPFGYGGLALANSLAAMLNVVMLLYVFRRRIGRFGLRRIGTSFIKTAAASSVMGVACYYITSTGPWSEDGMLLEKILLVGAGVTGGVLVYILIQMLLRSDELTFIYRTYKDRITGREA